MTSHLDHPQLISSDNPIITPAILADIEQRYQESVSNSIYVFPRHKSQQNHADISLDSMNDISSYNIYTQNPTITTLNEQPHTRPSSKASESDGLGSESTKETKSAAQGNKKLEFVKAKLENIEKKVVSLGQEDLLVLYKKTMNAYRETVKETPKSQVKTESIVQKMKEVKPLVVKIIKNRDAKTKDMENAYRSQAKSTQPGDRKAATYNGSKKDEKDTTKPVKDMTKFSKEFVHFLKEKTSQIKENMKPVLTTETDDEKLDTVRQLTELGPIQTEEKPIASERKSEGKPTPKKTVNLYVCYKSSSVSRSQGPKSRTEVQNKASHSEDKPHERFAKTTKTVQVIRDGNGIKEIKEVKEEAKKVKQVVLKDKAFSRTVNSFEKTKEAKPVEKKPTGVSTQNTEGSREASRLRGAATTNINNNKKGTTMYSDLYKTQKSKQSTDKKERVREFVAKALDLAKTMPAMKLKENLKTIEKEEKEDDKIVKEFEAIIEERCAKEDKSLAWSAVLASPVTVEKKREEIIRPSSTKWNLKVVTHSVVTEYEAKQRRRANEKRARKYF